MSVQSLLADEIKSIPTQVDSYPIIRKEIELDRTNPEYIGPGTWDQMHKDTFNAVTPEDQKGCCGRIRNTCYTFNCKTCRGHCTEYISTHPPEDYIGLTWTDPSDGTVYQLGLAIWVWKFHNAVNERLGKKLLRWDACFKMYTTLPEHCSSNCSEGDEKTETVPLNRKITNPNRGPVVQSRTTPKNNTMCKPWAPGPCR